MSIGNNNNSRIPYEIIVFIIVYGLISFFTALIFPGYLLIYMWESYLELSLGECAWGSSILFNVIWPITVVATYILIFSPFKKMEKFLKKFPIFLLLTIIEAIVLSYLVTIICDH
jgi:hypothetical protein